MYGGRSLLQVLIFNSCPAERQRVSSQVGQRFVQGRWRGTKVARGSCHHSRKTHREKRGTRSLPGTPCFRTGRPHLGCILEALSKQLSPGGPTEWSPRLGPGCCREHTITCCAVCSKMRWSCPLKCLEMPPLPHLTGSPQRKMIKGDVNLHCMITYVRHLSLLDPG